MATNKELEKTVNELSEKMDALRERFDNFTTAPTLPEQSMPSEFVPSPFTPPVEGSSPMPTEFSVIIDELLNRKFGRSIVYRADGQFELTIKVPKEYSNATPDHWNMYKEDSRMKVILNPLGAIAVREYIAQIAENLGQETRWRINEDRIKIA